MKSFSNNFLLRLLQIFSFLILAAFVTTLFFQRPIGDDFAGYYLTQKTGIAGTAISYLKNGTGRYFVIWFFAAVCSSRFLLENYFIIPLLFFFLTYSNIYLLAKSIKIKLNLETFSTHLLTAMLLLLFLYVMPDPASFVAWVTTACIFLLSFNVWLLQQHIFFKYFSEPKRNKRFIIFLLVLSVVIVGCDEITSFFSLLGLCIINVIHWLQSKKISRLFVLLLSIQVFEVMFTFLGPGNQARIRESGTGTSFGPALYSAAYQLFELLTCVFSNPLFWISVVIVLLYPSDNYGSNRWSLKPKWVSLLMAIMLFALFCFYLFLRLAGKRVLPVYTTNLIACYFIMLTLAMALSLRSQFSMLFNASKNLERLVAVAFLIILVFSSFTQRLYQTLLTGPTHVAVLDGQVKQIHDAVAQGRTSVHLQDYKDACCQQLSRSVGNHTANFIIKKYGFPPKLIRYPADSTSNFGAIDFSFAEFYRIDTIFIKGDTIVRWSVSKRPLWQNNEKQDGQF